MVAEAIVFQSVTTLAEVGLGDTAIRPKSITVNESPPSARAEIAAASGRRVLILPANIVVAITHKVAPIFEVRLQSIFTSLACRFEAWSKMRLSRRLELSIGE